MLTTSQTQLMAVITDGAVVCAKCAMEAVEVDLGVPCDLGGLRVYIACHDDWSPLIEYDLECWGDEGCGLYCDVCSAELVPPSCTACGDTFDDKNCTENGENKYGCRLCDDCYHEQEGLVECPECGEWFTPDGGEVHSELGPIVASYAKDAVVGEHCGELEHLAECIREEA